MEEWKTSSGGMFSPRVRESLANFLRFSLAVRTWGGREDIVVVVVVVVECMLKQEDVGELSVTSGLEGFILRGTGSDRS